MGRNTRLQVALGLFILVVLAAGLFIAFQQRGSIQSSTPNLHPTALSLNEAISLATTALPPTASLPGLYGAHSIDDYQVITNTAGTNGRLFNWIVQFGEPAVDRMHVVHIVAGVITETEEANWTYFPEPLIDPSTLLYDSTDAAVALAGQTDDWLTGYQFSLAADAPSTLIIRGYSGQYLPAAAKFDLITGMVTSPVAEKQFSGGELMVYSAATGVWQDRSPGGVVSQFSLSPEYSQDQTVFAYVLRDGLYKTTDAGLSWSKLPLNEGTAEGLTGISSINVNPHYAISKTLYLGSSWGAVFRTRDDGLTWNPTRDHSTDLVTEGYGEVLSIDTSPAYDIDRTVIVATREQGVLKSDTEGSVWEYLGGFDGARVVAISEEYDVDHTVYLLTNDALMKSVDGGTTWSEITTPIPATDAEQLLTSPLDGDMLILSGAQGVYSSTDQGVNWVQNISDPVSSIDLDTSTGQNIVFYTLWRIPGVYTFNLATGAGTGALYAPAPDTQIIGLGLKHIRSATTGGELWGSGFHQ